MGSSVPRKRELYIFARFHAREGMEERVAKAAFDRHSTLLHTQRFIETVEPLIDHPLDVVRTNPLENGPRVNL
jgi:hypothetical protein